MIVEATPDWHYAVRAPFSLRVLGSTFAFDGHVNLSGPVMEVDFPTAGRYRVRVDVARFEAAMLDDQDGCEITANFSDSSGNWQQVDARYEQEVAVEHPARLSMRVGGSCRRGLPADQLICINVVIDEPTPL